MSNNTEPDQNDVVNILEVDDLSLNFGGIKAVSNVKFHVKNGEIFSIIGPNGAGKTSLFNVITGIYNPTAGDLLLNNSLTYKIISRRDIILFSFLSLVSAFLLQNIWYIQSIWDAVIIKNYIYLQSFPWGTAFLDYFAFIYNTSWAPGCIAFFISFCAAYTIWNQFKRTPEHIASHGVSRTFQNIRLLKDLSVLDNVIIGMPSHRESPFLAALFNLSSERSSYRSSKARARELLEFVGLEKSSNNTAGSLPYGHQRRLEIARALASNPKILLLDEPAAGMNPSEAKSLISLIKEIRELGITVLLIEHHMKVVMNISDRILVLNYGECIACGAPLEIRSNKDVVSAYLGRG